MQIISFFSQTGSEIANLIEKRVYDPDLIVTNKRLSTIRKIDPRLEGKYVTLPNKPTVEDYEHYLEVFDPKDTLITLHGWLRIIPPELCSKYNIVNGHPGLITKYPELKGKDPQIRAYKARHKVMGGVVHKVSPEVDEGEILYSQEFSSFNITEEKMWELHKVNSLELWKKFLVDYMRNNRTL